VHKLMTGTIQMQPASYVMCRISYYNLVEVVHVAAPSNLPLAQLSPLDRLFSVSRCTSNVPNWRSCGAYSRAIGISCRIRSFLAGSDANRPRLPDVSEVMAPSKSPKRNWTNLPTCWTIYKGASKGKSKLKPPKYSEQRTASSILLGTYQFVFFR